MTFKGANALPYSAVTKEYCAILSFLQNKGEQVTHDVLGIVTSSLSRLKVAIGLHETELTGVNRF